ncbi:hypothetical protein DM860_004145 [Cuscuta australis]|uniref:Arf-GAP domain-containing protein n=1 Tax=Cuscuta australis TaxID=267555 RepID=A0A328D019_9ASTE|nr:hypothetical protein DM860_004145 [Cuscuta australis]
MASRFKEDEKNERAIRSLLKLPDNRRCINCNSLGPQYVCINFSTFICTNCSGIHREFTHRVKSVSMAKFTSQEVSALQGGGNASAKEIYLKEWDPQRNSLPDGSNVERLRDFIKHVYVDRRYTGERGFPRGKGETEDINENKRVDTYPGSAQSSGGRSPGYDQEIRKNTDHRKSLGSGVINDWRREDRFGNDRRLEGSRSFDGGSKVDIKSPDRRSDLGTPSPPMVRPVRDILGDNTSPLRVIEPPKVSVGARQTDAPARTQRSASSTSLASSNGSSTEIKAEPSLIDFEAVPEPSPAVGVQQTQQLTNATPVMQPTSSGVDNWANFESQPVKAPSNANQLDVLSKLMAPALAPVQMGGNPASSAPVDFFPASGSSPIPADVTHLSNFGPSSFPPEPTSLLQVGSTVSLTSAAGGSGGQWPSMQPQHPSLPLGTGTQSLPHHSIPVSGGHPNNQQWNPIAPSGILNTSSAQGPQAVSEHAMDPTSRTAAPAVDVKSSGRKELPADLFAATYPSIHAPVQGWYAAPQHGHGFSMQYNNMQMQTHTPMQPVKSSNPFDTTNEPSPLQASTFPSVASLQGALPNLGAPASLIHTSHHGTPQIYHPHINMHQQPPSYLSAHPPNSYMGQHLAASLPQRPYNPAGYDLGAAAFATTNTNQQIGGLHAAATPAQNTFSPAGNPFG